MSISTVATTPETLEERLERRMAEQAAAREEALKRVTELCRRTNISGPSSHPWKGGLHFEASGAARLANIAGFIYGLTVQGEMTPLDQLAGVASDTATPRDLAIRLAVSIDEKLTYLAGYGGETEIEVEEAEENRPATSVKVPAYKVILYDDGTFGGFGILWHRPLTAGQVQAKAREADEASYQGKESDGTVLSDEDSRRRWDAALAGAREKLRIRKDLEENRCWTPWWVQRERLRAEGLHEEHKPTDGSYSSAIWGCEHEDCLWSRDRLKYSTLWELIQYGFSFNGGLLLHGMGHQTFSVQLNADGPSWSIHT
jgi:hypothetical protein